MATQDPQAGKAGEVGGGRGDGDGDDDDFELRRAAVRLSLWQSLGRASRQLIYSIVMRSGGEPFGAPFELGLQSLTEQVVKRLSQHSFFGFEALEKMELRGRRNKFTRHGAAPYRGPHRQAPTPADGGLGSGRRPRGLLMRLSWRRRR